MRNRCSICGAPSGFSHDMKVHKQWEELPDEEAKEPKHEKKNKAGLRIQPWHTEYDPGC